MAVLVAKEYQRDDVDDWLNELTPEQYAELAAAWLIERRPEVVADG